MIRTRVIPCLLLDNGALVKTTRFKKAVYIGDPINSVRIYNELMVDELVFLDISASIEGRPPNFSLIRNIASECFMPFAYGGGIKTMEHAKQLFDSGVEKIVLNSAAIETPDFISELTEAYGSQAIIASIDVQRNFFGKQSVMARHGRVKSVYDPVTFAKKMEAHGVGEILLNNISNDGMMQGFDTDLIARVASCVSIPVIALGGAGEISDIAKARTAGASAVGLGSMAVYQNKNKGILINFPKRTKLLEILKEK